MWSQAVVEIAVQWSVEFDFGWVWEGDRILRGHDEVDEDAAADGDGDFVFVGWSGGGCVDYDCGSGAARGSGHVVSVEADGCAKAGAFHEAKNDVSLIDGLRDDNVLSKHLVFGFFSILFGQTI